MWTHEQYREYYLGIMHCGLIFTDPKRWERHHLEIVPFKPTWVKEYPFRLAVRGDTEALMYSGRLWETPQ